MQKIPSFTKILLLLTTHTSCFHATFNLLDCPQYLIEDSVCYKSYTGSSYKTVAKSNACLINDPLKAEYFYEIFKDKEHVTNFINAILFPTTPQKISSVRASSDYTNTPGKPIIWQCFTNYDKTFEIILSVSNDYQSNMVAYYSRINDRKSANYPIKYFTFYTGDNNANLGLGKNIGIFSSSLDLQRSSTKKIDNVLDEIIINAHITGEKILSTSSQIKIANADQCIGKEGLQWLKLLTIAYYQNPIKGKYVIPSIDLSSEISAILTNLNESRNHIDWNLSLYPSEYNLIEDIHNATKTEQLETIITNTIAVSRQNTTINDVPFLEHFANQCTNISNGVTNIKNTVTNLDTHISNIESNSTEISKSSSEINSKLDTINTLNTSVTSVTSSIDTVKNLINQINASLYSVQQNTDESGQIITGNVTISQQVEALRAITMGVSATMGELYSLLVSFPTSTNITTEFNKIENAIQSLLGALTNVSSLNLKELSETIANINSVMIDLNKNIGAFAVVTQIPSIAEKTETIENTTNTSLESVNNLGNQLTTTSETISQINTTNSTISNTLTTMQNSINTVSQKIDQIKPSSGSGESSDSDYSALITYMQDNLPQKKDLDQQLNDIINKLNAISSGSITPTPTPEPEQEQEEKYDLIKPYLEKLPFKTYTTEKECASILANNPQLIYYISSRILGLDALTSFGDSYSEASVMTSTQNKHGGDIQQYIRRNRAFVFYHAFKDEFTTIHENIKKFLKHGNGYSDMYNRLYTMIIESTARVNGSFKPTIATSIMNDFWIDKLPFQDLSSQGVYQNESWDSAEDATRQLQLRSYDNISTSTIIQSSYSVSDTNLNNLSSQFKSILDNSQYFLFYLMGRYICADIETTKAANSDSDETFSEYQTMALGNCHMTVKNKDYNPARKQILTNRLYVLKKAFPYNEFHTGAIADYNLKVFQHWLDIYLSETNNRDVLAFIEWSKITNMAISKYWTETYHKNLEKAY